MGLILPAFAKPIADARAAGKRPTEMVVVSDGRLGLHNWVCNPVVTIDVKERPSLFDWRFLADLDVEIATTGDAQRIQMLASAIVKVLPWYLRVWRVDTNTLTRVRWMGVNHVCPETLCN